MDAVFDQQPWTEKEKTTGNFTQHQRDWRGRQVEEEATYYTPPKVYTSPIKKKEKKKKPVHNICIYLSIVLSSIKCNRNKRFSLFPLSYSKKKVEPRTQVFGVVSRQMLAPGLKRNDETLSKSARMSKLWRHRRLWWTKKKEKIERWKSEER